MTWSKATSMNSLIHNSTMGGNPVMAATAGEIAQHAVGGVHTHRMVTALEAPIPYSEPLENYVVPHEDEIVEAVKSVLVHEIAAA